MEHRFVELSAVRTPPAPTAVCRPVSPAISLLLAGDARVRVHRALGLGLGWVEAQLWPDCLVLADVDECRNRSFCGSHAVCQNLPGSFQCLCDQGYEGARDGRHCVGTGHGGGWNEKETSVRIVEFQFLAIRTVLVTGYRNLLPPDFICAGRRIPVGGDLNNIFLGWGLVLLRAYS